MPANSHLNRRRRAILVPSLLVSLFTRVASRLCRLGRGFAPRDITQRTRAEEERELYRLMVERVVDYAIFRLDPEGRVASWNAGAQRIKGYRADEILGQPFTRFYPAEDVARGKPAYLLQVVATEGRVEDEGWRVRKDGSRFWASVVITVLYDDQGRLTGFSKITRDLTERKWAEEARRRAEEQYRGIFEHASEGIFQSTIDGRLLLANPALARMLGYDSPEALIASISDLGQQLYAEPQRWSEMLQMLQERGTVAGLELQLYRRDGSRIWGSISLHALKDEDGRLTGTQGMVENITERRRAAQRLQALASASRAFAELVPDYERLLQMVAEQIAEATGDACTVRLLSDDGQFMVPVAAHHPDPELRADIWTVIHETVQRADIGVWRPVLEELRTLRIAIPYPEIPPQASPTQAEFIRRHPMSALQAAPLIARGRVLGGISLVRYGPQAAYTPDDAMFLQDIADRAALAIDNARLYRDVQAENVERKWAEEERERVLQHLEIERGRLEAVLEQMPTGVNIAEAPSGRILLGNAQVARIWRHPFLPAEGMEQWRQYQGFHPDGRPYEPAEWPMARSITTGAVVLAEEITIQRGDGTYGTIELNSAPIRDQTGTIVAGVAIYDDITARKQAEEALTARARQQAEIAQLGQHALANPQIDILFDNAVMRVAQALEVEYCKILELLPDGQALLLRAGVGWQEGAVGHATVGAGSDSQAGYTLASSEPVIVEDLRSETRFRGPPLLHDHAVVSGMSVIIHGHDRPFGVLGAHTSKRRTFTQDDVHFLQAVANVVATAIAHKRADDEIRALMATLEQRVQERTRQLEAANAALEAFSYTASHDMRAPLRGIQGLAQALLEDHAAQLDPAGYDYAHRIGAAAERMDQLIQDLLLFAHLSRAELRLQPVNLRRVLDAALDHIAAELHERQAQVTVADHLPQVLGHPTILVQVLTNLLTNAVKFVAPGTQPQVQVWAEECGDQVRLWIADNGIGIAAHDQARIFDIFERLHGMDHYAGSGIGLAIVRTGVERLGGQVGIESQLGQGSRFWIELRSGTARSEGEDGRAATDPADRRQPG